MIAASVTQPWTLFATGLRPSSERDSRVLSPYRMMAVAAPRRLMLLKATLGTQMCPWCRTRRQVELQCQAALKGLLLAILPGDCLARSTGGAFCAPGVPKVQLVRMEGALK